MKKFLLVFVSVLVLFPIYAMDVGSGFSVGGGVKTGLLVKNSDYGNKLGTIAGIDEKYPMSLYFASNENQAYNGVGWLTFAYSHQAESVGTFGLQLGMWANGSLKEYQDILHMGDHYLWANFFDNRLRFIGGQGGGTPISSGGWLNADWLSYTGLRFFWVDPIGLSIGVKFPDPGRDGIKPVNYFTMLGAGAGFKYENFFVSVLFDNSPIYDDSDSNYYGGLHRPDEQDPIAVKGNIAFGAGMEKLYGGKGMVAVEGLFTNLGEELIESGNGEKYHLSPIVSTFALKTGYPVTDALYAEVKGKYTIRQGDNEDATGVANWGKFEFEPYISFKPFNLFTIHMAVYGAVYINSYYLALKPGDRIPGGFEPGQVPGHSPLLDYLSPYELSIKPKISLNLSGVDIDLGYSGSFSRDHVENTVYLDFRWQF